MRKITKLLDLFLLLSMFFPVIANAHGGGKIMPACFCLLPSVFVLVSKDEGKFEKRYNEDEWTPLQLSLTSSTQLVSNIKTVKGLRVSLFGAENENVYGLDLGLTSSEVYNNVTGIQISGLFNKCYGKMTGIQISGIANFSGGPSNSDHRYFPTRGIQIGFNNIAFGSLQGIQIGVGNLTDKDKEESAGIQLGVGNLSESISGIQMALSNNTRQVKGLQFGFINIAEKVKGVQVGVVNYCEKMVGVQLGVFNIITESALPFFPLANASFSF